MNQYEITYLVNPKTQEEDREKLNGAFDAKIAELAGKIEHTSPTLRRNLAYEVKKQQGAFIRTIQLELEGQHIEEIQTLLKKDKNILRFSVLNTPKRQEVSTEVLEKAQTKPGKKPIKKMSDKPTKKLTMKEVEKGIEEALSEEVK